MGRTPHTVQHVQYAPGSHMSTLDPTARSVHYALGPHRSAFCPTSPTVQYAPRNRKSAFCPPTPPRPRMTKKRKTKPSYGHHCAYGYYLLPTGQVVCMPFVHPGVHHAWYFPTKNTTQLCTRIQLQHPRTPPSFSTVPKYRSAVTTKLPLVRKVSPAGPLPFYPTLG